MLKGETMNNFNVNGMINQRNPYSTTPTNNIIWVNGIEGAKAWQLNPNSMVILLDSETDGKMYIKVSDSIGMPSLRIFNYVEEVQTLPTNNVTNNSDLDLSQYVKKDELEKLIKEFITNEPIISTAAASVPDDAAKSRVITTIKKQ